MADRREHVEGDVPPLEDMSEVMEKIKVIKGHSTDESEAQPAPVATAPSVTTPSSSSSQKTQKKTQEPAVKKAVKKQPETFGGFKKGFMFPSSSASKPKPKPAPAKPAKKKEEVPFIRPSAPKDTTSQYQIPEVQDAMNSASAFSQNTEWVNDDLLKNVTENPTLWKRLSDPAFMQAITEFQTNPKAAWDKYGDNPEMQTFLKEFCNLMGTHFSGMTDSPGPNSESTSSKKDDDIIRPASEQKAPAPSPKVSDVQIHPEGGAGIKVHNPSQPSAADEAKMKEILADPEICELLMDGRVQRVIETLRNDPSQGQKLLNEAGPEMQVNIRKLVEAGLLSFER